ncbi:hypothetical protein [Mycobacterium sp. DL592]|uniref:hypothetical protein n=1 Tax=Mycobacterium sp. DL592 TaxID=2675524 RepID=UPI0014214C8E|nr:hypothetical protein [Mycobacterium sp. DL592]
MSIEIIIDPNVRVADNRTYSGFEDVLGGFVEDLVPGAPVVVLEEESDVVGNATVYEVDYEKELIYLTVNWSSLAPRLSRPLPSASVSAVVRATVGPVPHEESNLGFNVSRVGIDYLISA